VRIVSLDEYKGYAGVTVTTYDDRILGLLDAATGMIEAYTRRTWGEINSYTEYFDIVDEYKQDVMVAHYPIVSVTALVDDYEDSDGSGTTLDTEDYNINTKTGVISLDEDDYFTMGPKKVKVVYTAGAVTIPEDVKLACKMQVKYLFDQRDNFGVQSERMGDYSVTYRDGEATGGGLIATAVGILKLHRKIL